MATWYNGNREVENHGFVRIVYWFWECPFNIFAKNRWHDKANRQLLNDGHIFDFLQAIYVNIENISIHNILDSN